LFVVCEVKLERSLFVNSCNIKWKEVVAKSVDCWRLDYVVCSIFPCEHVTLFAKQSGKEVYFLTVATLSEKKL